MLPEITSINKHVINLKNRKYLFYKPISAFNLIELEILKAYIKIYLKTKVIKSFKSLANIFIFFAKKSNGSLHLCFNYRGLNKFIVKNQNFFLLIRRFLNQLGYIEYFIKLDLANIYYQIRI